MPTEPTPLTGDEDKQTLSAPLRVVSEFYEAFNQRDLEKLAENWAQTDQIAMDNPVGGIKRGWAEIQAVYERIFSGQATVYVEFYEYTLHEQADLFYVVGREQGEYRLGEIVLALAFRTTRIFQRLEGHWRQVHHHGSIEDPELLARYQQAIRAGT